MKDTKPLDLLKYFVSGAIERDEKEAITSVKENKFTPGPWTVDGSTAHRSICGDNFTVAHIHQPRLMELPESAANADLIAAAPEMFKALKSLLILADIVMKNDGSDDCSIRLAARQALDKAQGVK